MHILSSSLTRQPISWLGAFLLTFGGISVFTPSQAMAQEPVIISSDGNGAVFEITEEMLMRLMNGDPRLPKKVTDTSFIAAARKTPVQLKFTAMDGKAIDLAQLRGKVVAIDFWALTDCNECSAHETAVKRAYEKYHDKGFEVIRLVLETKADVKGQAEQEAKENNIPWPQWFDGDAPNNAFLRKYVVRKIPSLMILDKRGLLVDTGVKAVDLEGYVESTLKKK